jgi:alpha-mannosidase
MKPRHAFRHDLRATEQQLRNALSRLEERRYVVRLPLSPLGYARLAGPGAPWPALDQAQPIPPHSYWGENDSDFVLYGVFRVPQDWAGGRLALHLPLGDGGLFCHPEALAYVDDRPLCAVTRFHQELLLPDAWANGQERRLTLHGYTGNWFAHYDFNPHARLLMGEPALVRIDEGIAAMAVTARLALETAQRLDDSTPTRARLLSALEEALLVSPQPEATSLGELREALAEAGPPLDVDIFGVGHAHLDVAWLWTLDQTRQKARRTFYNVLAMMERLPNYCFAQGQPQLYDFVRQDDPTLFAAIQRRVAEGRWELLSGGWVEADANLSGSEALARHLMYGADFFQRHFGSRGNRILWLPDSFGYSAALPQLARLAGLDYFFSTKMGWNQHNDFPYNSFWWHGLDGSRLLAHFSSTPEPGNLYHRATYNAEVNAEALMGTWLNFRQAGEHDALLMAFGYGDGGGAASETLLANAAEVAQHPIPGLPRFQFSTAQAFYERLEQQADELPAWHGELYLEAHRATYTTQARIKQANRRSETLLHNAELLATWASLRDSSYSYPRAELRSAWELLLLNQFHDILPGSSIGPVYQEARRQYADLEHTTTRISEEALACLAAQHGGGELFLNPNPTPSPPLVLEDGRLLASLPPYTAVGAEAIHPITCGAEAGPRHLENELMRVELDDAGDIVRIFDKQQAREVLAGGQRVEWLAYHDAPLQPVFDACELDLHTLDRPRRAEAASSVRVLESEGARAVVEIERRILGSPYRLRLSLDCASPRLDFETWIDWRERHTLLRAVFPLNILTREALYEIQWGHVARPTHRNTRWDWSRFEVPAHRWAALCEADYAIALLNDSKYGYAAYDHTLALSLLRAPTAPDPQADQGEHQFSYALLATPLGLGEVIAQAAAFNNPPLRLPALRSSQPPMPWDGLFAADDPDVLIETIKHAEDGQGIIVRLFMSQRRRTQVHLRAAFPMRAAQLCDLHEEPLRDLALDEEGQLSLALRPFEIVTLRLLPQRQ